MSARQVVHENVVINNLEREDVERPESQAPAECDLDAMASQVADDIDAEWKAALIDDTIALTDRESSASPSCDSPSGGKAVNQTKVPLAPRFFLPALGLSIAIAFQLGVEISGQGLFSLSPPATILLLTAVVAIGFTRFLYRGWIQSVAVSASGSRATGHESCTGEGQPSNAKQDLSMANITDVMKSRLIADLNKGEETVRKEKLEEELHNLRGELDARLCEELEQREEAIRESMVRHVEKISVFFESLFEKHVFRLNRELREKEAEIASLVSGSQVQKRKDEEKQAITEKQAEEIEKLQGMIEELESRQTRKEPESPVEQDSPPEPLSLAHGNPPEKSNHVDGISPALVEEFREQLCSRLRAASQRTSQLLSEDASRRNGSTAGTSPSGQGNIADEVVSELSALDRLVGQIENLEKLQASEWKKELSDVQVHDVVKKARNHFREVTKEKGVRISTRISKDIESVVLDRTLLEQALTEVLGNAIAYSNRSGRVNVSATLESGDGTDRGWLSLRVKDNGRGVPKKDQDRIFEPFKQGKKPRPSLTGAGEGIGLTLARACVEELGGTLRVEGKPGKGSTFVLTIPLEAVAV